MKLYRHYKKGDIYEVISEHVTHTETTEILVVYRSLETGLFWARPKRDFHMLVNRPDGLVLPRFEEVK